MARPKDGTMREGILSAAFHMFGERGFGATTIKDLARSLDGLAALYVQEARYVEAEAMLERAVSIHELGGSERVELGQSLGQLGMAYAGQERLPEAQEALRRSLEIVEQELDADHPLVAATRVNYERINARPPSDLEPPPAEAGAEPAQEEAAPAE